MKSTRADGSTPMSRFWIVVYDAVGYPARFFRRLEIWAIGKAGDATDWGDP